MAYSRTRARNHVIMKCVYDDVAIASVPIYDESFQARILFYSLVISQRKKMCSINACSDRL